MTIIYLLLLLAALALFALAAVRYAKGTQGKTLLAAGLACWVAVPLLQTLASL